MTFAQIMNNASKKFFLHSVFVYFISQYLLKFRLGINICIYIINFFVTIYEEKTEKKYVKFRVFVSKHLLNMHQYINIFKLLLIIIILHSKTSNTTNILIHEFSIIIIHTPSHVHTSF